MPKLNSLSFATDDMNPAQLQILLSSIKTMEEQEQIALDRVNSQIDELREARTRIISNQRALNEDATTVLTALNQKKAV